jgi:hypothetical protein
LRLLTARTSSNRCSRVGNSLIGTGSDGPIPRLSNRISLVFAANRLRKADEAEAVYWEDLKRNAESPWSLAGLVQALKTQGESDEAAFAEQRLQKAWRNREKPEAVAALFQLPKYNM